MESGAYGASLAGGHFDFMNFIKQPQTIVRILSWIFSIVVFATITGEGYINEVKGEETKCIFNKNDSACGFGVGVGILAFLACVIFIILDAYFPQISSAKERKNIVTGDLVFSGVWTFLWFTCFCVLANQWSHTTELLQEIPVDAARAVVAFSFFSIVTWAVLTQFAYTRYRQGVSDFDQGYTDPANDRTTPYPATSAYPPYPNSGPEGYQQSPFTPQNQEQPAQYQPPSY
ncbi:synaptogyrin-2a [Esox lucius]|uniref:Synaptogyrin n=1 Tax=Esox lucius TaxID=8010 RepID=A0AAY5KVR9_ESOLU|nr:synaptogyrin-2a [Esox lucius]